VTRVGQIAAAPFAIVVVVVAASGLQAQEPKRSGGSQHRADGLHAGKTTGMASRIGLLPESSGSGCCRHSDRTSCSSA
jgi:hypothetical protein